MNILNLYTSARFLEQAKTFLISFIIVVIAYGGKLVGQSYANDDYFRMYFTESWFNQADRGRWFTSILNHFIFKNEFFVLPYFNTIISLLFITLSGFIITKIWNIKNQLLVCLLTLIITISPFWANNLFFNSNVTVGIGAFLASLGVYYLIKKNKILIGGVLLVFGFGIYQTIFQSSLIICLGFFIIKLLEITNLKELKKLIIINFKYLVYVVFIFVISQVISELIFKGNKADVLFSPYNAATREFNFQKIIKKIIYLYTSPNGFLGEFIVRNYYFGVLTFIIFLSGLYFSVISVFKKHKNIKYNILIIFFTILLVLSIIIQIPRILGVLMPLRSCFHFSILLALFVILSINNKIALLKNISVVSVFLYILLSFGYISSFYNQVNRQTELEINKANQIVNRIRLHPDFNFSNANYPYFLILGEKQKTKNNKSPYYNNPSYGKDLQALNASYSKYDLFKHFTDFKFKKVDRKKDSETVIKYLKNITNIGQYPEKNSIFIIDNIVILVLNNDLK